MPKRFHFYCEDRESGQQASIEEGINAKGMNGRVSSQSGDEAGLRQNKGDRIYGGHLRTGIDTPGRCFYTMDRFNTGKKDD